MFAMRAGARNRRMSVTDGMLGPLGGVVSSGPTSQVGSEPAWQRGTSPDGSEFPSQTAAKSRQTTRRTSLAHLLGGGDEYRALALDDPAIVYESTEEPMLSTLEQLQLRGQDALSSVIFQSCVGVLIIGNAAVIGAETDSPELSLWEPIERLFLFAFTLELLLRILFFGFHSFFDPRGLDHTWNVFDFCVVCLGIFDFCVGQLVGQMEGDGVATIFRIVRLLRILRIFRIIRFVRQLYILAYGFALAAVAVFWVLVLLMSGLYVCSVVLVRTLGSAPKSDSDYEFFQEKFSTIPKAMFSLFQLTVQPNLTEYHHSFNERPLFAIFIVIFVFFGSLGMIALLTGVLSEAMFEKNMLRMDEGRQEREVMCKTLVSVCGELFDRCEGNHHGETSLDDMHCMLPRIAEVFDEFQVPYTRYDLESMISVMDTDGSGAINRTEFCRGILQMAQEVRPMLVMQLHYEGMCYHKEKSKWMENEVTLLHGQLNMLQETVQADTFLKRTARGVDAGDWEPAGAEVAAGLAPLPVQAATISAAANADLLGSLRDEIRSLQGVVFSIGSRMEELLSDARCERTQSQLSELNELRRGGQMVPDLKESMQRCESQCLRTHQSSEQLKEQITNFMSQSLAGASHLFGASSTARSRGSGEAVSSRPSRAAASDGS